MFICMSTKKKTTNKQEILLLKRKENLIVVTQLVLNTGTIKALNGNWIGN